MFCTCVQIFAVLYFILTQRVVSLCTTSAGHRWTIYDSSMYLQGFQHYLDNYVVYQRTVFSVLECAEICQQNPTECQSFNFWRRSSLCQINSAARTDQHITAGDYKESPNAIYVNRDTFVNINRQSITEPCVASPCFNGGICIEDCDVNGYICICQSGYTGSNCQHSLQSVDCSEPGIPEFGSHTGDITNGSTVTFLCDSGYTLVGSSSIYCSSGTWTGDIPTCHADCVVLTPPGNGQMIGSNFVHGSVVSFSCDVDYTMIGPSSVTCEDGIWNSTAPSCYADCVVLTPPANGQMIGSNFVHGSVVTFSCDVDYTMVGVPSVACDDGVWNDSVPSCHADCTDPGTPPSSTRSGETNHGSALTYNCTQGYAMLGSDTVICMDGSWDDTAPACYDITPDLYWDMSGKCSQGDLDPDASCPGDSCSTIYDNIGGYTGTVTGILDLVPAPAARLGSHLCVAHMESSDFVNFGDFSGTCFTDQSFCPDGITISTWMFYDLSSNPSSVNFIVSTGGQTTQGRGVTLYTNNGALIWMIKSYQTPTTLNNYAYQIDAFPDAQWFHLVCVFHPTDLGAVYFNGAVQWVAATFNTKTTGDHLYTDAVIGASNSDYTFNSDVAFSDFKVFYRSLSANEVTTLYQEELAGN